MTVTADQITVFGVLAATLGLFVRNRWRYDIVALLSLFVQKARHARAHRAFRTAIFNS